MKLEEAGGGRAGGGGTGGGGLDPSPLSRAHVSFFVIFLFLYLVIPLHRFLWGELTHWVMTGHTIMSFCLLWLRVYWFRASSVRMLVGGGRKLCHISNRVIMGSCEEVIKIDLSCHHPCLKLLLVPCQCSFLKWKYHGPSESASLLFCRCCHCVRTVVSVRWLFSNSDHH